MLPNLFSPIQTTDVRTRRITLKSRLEKLGRFLEIPLDEQENRESEKEKVIQCFQTHDPTRLIPLVTKTNLTAAEDLAKVEQIMDNEWDVDYYLLFFVAMKLDQKILMARLKQFFEYQFVTLAPSTHMLDRSFLSENMEKYEALPKPHQDYLIKLLLSVEVPSNEISVEGDGELLPGPSNVVYDPLKTTRSSATLPQMFRLLENTDTMDNETLKLVVDELLRDFGANLFESELLQDLLHILKERTFVEMTVGPANCPGRALKRKLKTAEIEKLGRTINSHLCPYLTTKSVHELLVLWSITHPYIQSKIAPNYKEHLWKELRIFFNYQFALTVPASSSFCFINRSYHIEHRSAIAALPDEAQTFLQKCLLTCPTKGHEDHEPNSVYANGFFLGDPGIVEDFISVTDALDSDYFRESKKLRDELSKIELDLSENPDLQDALNLSFPLANDLEKRLSMPTTIRRYHELMDLFKEDPLRFAKLS